MIDYLALERSVSGFAESEKSEKSEITPEPEHVALTADHGEEEPVVTLVWCHVDRGPVAASAPPPGWDGTLPANCGWPALCHVLGPCPSMRTRDNCPFAHSVSVSTLAGQENVGS
jgi:hypothetical protein